ncbi:MAG: Hsp33 family molecular chaperone HslO [Deltaproteobacteria bacterium]|jgi:molecular chaperone Hsp33
MSTTDLENLPMDRAISAVTHDGSFRVLAVRSTRTVRGLVKSQAAAGPTVENLADLASGTILVRLTMAPNYRVQGIIQDARGGTLVADSWPDGGTRALVRSQGPVLFGPGSRMQLMRSLPNGAMHQGIVEVSREHRVSGAVMNYLLESEQVTSALGVASVVSDEGEVLLAGGYVVQLLPECTEPPLAVMYERLRHDFADLGRVLAELDADPDRVVAEILSGMDYTRTLEFELDFRCRCSSERVLASLATVGKDELEDMIRKAEPLSITCDYCRQEYEVQTEMLRGLLETS